jgi:hypothetical protein
MIKYLYNYVNINNFSYRIVERCGSMTLATKIIQVVPREISGSDTFRRYDFQIAVAFDLIIELIKENKNFSLLMDHLDDIVILNDKDNPTMINFYQVKTSKNKSITINTVISNNWLQYMTENRSQFKDYKSKAHFISNQYVQSGKKILFEDLEYHALSDIEDEKIKETITIHIGEIESEVELSDYYIAKSKLTLNDFTNQIIGNLSSLFAEERYNKLNSWAIKTLYNELKDKLMQAEGRVITNQHITFSNLVKKKGVTSQTFTEIVDNLKDEQLPENVRDLVEFAEHHCNYDFDGISILKLIRRYRNFINDYYKNRDIYKKYKTVMHDIEENRKSDDLKEIVKELTNNKEVGKYQFIETYADFLVIIFYFKGGVL